MKRTKLKVLKNILTEVLEFNSKSISDTFSQLGIVFFGALLGVFIYFNLLENQTSFMTLLILIVIFFLISFIFNILKHRKRWGELLRELGVF